MCEASGCGAQVRLADIPLSASAAHVVAAEAGQYAAVLAGGDDYEVLVSIPAQSQAAFKQAAAAAGVAVTRIGIMTVGNRVDLESADGKCLILRPPVGITSPRSGQAPSDAEVPCRGARSQVLGCGRPEAVILQRWLRGPG